MGETSTAEVGSFTVKLGGAPLAPDLSGNLTEARVETAIGRPASCTLRFADPKYETFGSFAIGAEIEVAAGPQGRTRTIFKGEVTAVEADYDAAPAESSLVVRAHDKLHRLHLGRKTRSFLNMKDSDLVAVLAAELSLSASAESTATVHPYLLQNNETGFEFLTRRARRLGMEILADGGALKLRKRPQGSAGVELTLGTNLVRFRARMDIRHGPSATVTEVAARGWDRLRKSAIVGVATTSAHAPAIAAAKGATAGAAFGRSKVALLTDASSQAEASALATAEMDRLAASFVTADAVAFGDPAISAGVTASIGGVGTKLSGTYYVAAATHVWKEGGYTTELGLSTRPPGDASDPFADGEARPASGHGVSGLTIGIVTNNKPGDGDPAGQEGRVKVKFPVLPADPDGTAIESTWARIATPMAGAQRGFLFLPELDDEVLVGFEGGDVHRPVVLGALWNGKDPAPEPAAQLVTSDGKVTRRLLRTRSGHTVSFDDGEDTPGITIVDKTQKNRIAFDSRAGTITIESEGDLVLKAKGRLTLDAQDIQAKARNALTLKSVGTATIDAATIKMNDDALVVLR